MLFIGTIKIKKMAKNRMYRYCYQTVRNKFGWPDARLVLEEYDIIKETECGYWIDNPTEWDKWSPDWLDKPSSYIKKVKRFLPVLPRKKL